MATLEAELLNWYDNLDPVAKAEFLADVLAAYPDLGRQMSEIGLTDIGQVIQFTDEAIRSRFSEEVIR